uniref:Uncharacterized protein n=1 Tax=viral metagenome TaxID=1070528 RepID=A0A2V0RHN2_9ZZZZ
MSIQTESPSVIASALAESIETLTKSELQTTEVRRNIQTLIEAESEAVQTIIRSQFVDRNSIHNLFPKGFFSKKKIDTPLATPERAIFPIPKASSSSRKDAQADDDEDVDDKIVQTPDQIKAKIAELQKSLQTASPRHESEPRRPVEDEFYDDVAEELADRDDPESWHDASLREHPQVTTSKTYAQAIAGDDFVIITNPSTGEVAKVPKWVHTQVTTAVSSAYSGENYSSQFASALAFAAVKEPNELAQLRGETGKEFDLKVSTYRKGGYTRLAIDSRSATELIRLLTRKPKVTVFPCMLVKLLEEAIQRYRDNAPVHAPKEGTAQAQPAQKLQQNGRR